MDKNLEGVVWVCHGCNLWSEARELSHADGCQGVPNPFRVDDLPHGVA